MSVNPRASERLTATDPQRRVAAPISVPWTEILPLLAFDLFQCRNYVRPPQSLVQFAQGRLLARIGAQLLSQLPGEGLAAQSQASY